MHKNKDLSTAMDMFINNRIFETPFEEEADAEFIQNEERIRALIAEFSSRLNGELLELLSEFENVLNKSSNSYQIMCYKRGFKDGMQMFINANLHRP